MLQRGKQIKNGAFIYRANNGIDKLLISMTISREDLLNIKDMPLQKRNEITQTLFTMLHEGKPLTLAEEKYICLSLKTIRDEKGKIAFNASNFTQCADFLFWEKYLLYWADHEGLRPVLQRPNLPIPREQKIKDVKFLNDHYESWQKIIYADRYSTTFLQTVANETKRLVKEVINYSKQLGESENRLKYIEKALILHSKYVYFQVREYYEEINAEEESINFCKDKLVIDHFAYVHILFGHFAEQIKFGRPGKSYHRDGGIDFRYIPKIILDLIEKYSKNGLCQYFNGQHIFLKLERQFYAIWFRKITRSVKGTEPETILRVQTFYPVEQADDLSKIQKLERRRINPSLDFYI